MKKTNKNERTLEKTIAYILAIGGMIGVIAAFVLTVEKIELLKNPSYIPTCNVSPLISCGSVMKTGQAAIFGFPNMIMGLIGFSVVTTIGMAMLAGATFKRWFWIGLQTGTIFGILFVHWLFYQSVYVIGALCPYCMVVWSVMIPIFLYTTLYNIRVGHIRLSAKTRRTTDFVQKHHGDILLVWYLIIILLILNRFWYYWSSLV